MKESIFFASIRAFFVSLFAILGIFFAFFPIIYLLSYTSTSLPAEAETVYTPEIVANAEGKRKALASDAPVILKININGVIGLDHISMANVRQQLLESRENTLKNNRVKGIMLYMNTPGGTVVDADGIYHALKAYKEQYKVPIYAYVDGLCASGGMYIAMAANEIYSSDVSMIGSIGVLSPPFFNVSKLIKDWGIEALTLTAGKDKDELNPFRPWKPDESENIQELIKYYYGIFVDTVASNRPEVSKEKLINDYGAKVFNPVQAQEIGYITAAGKSYNDALKKLVKAVGIEDDFYQVIELKKESWYTSLFSKDTLSLFKGQVTHSLQLPQELDPRLMNQFLYLYRP